MAFEITDECSGCAACVPSCPAGAIRGIARSLHQIDPALCIDCGACGVVCPDQAVRDPRGMIFSLFEAPRGRRAFVELSRCTGCGWCVDTCGFDAVRGVVVNTEDGLALTFATVNPARCTSCGACELECDDEAIKVIRVEGDDVESLRERNARFLTHRRVTRREVT
jgi:ferredoxin